MLGFNQGVQVGGEVMFREVILNRQSGWLCGLAIISQVLAGGAHGASYKRIYSFPSAQLGNPATGVTASGTAIYGILPGGIAPEPGKNCSKGCGGFYESEEGHTTIPFKFKFKDGATPAAPLLLSNGSFYGTTENGGSGKACGLFGCGVIFQIDTDGSGEQVLYSFCSKAKCADGYLPSGPLIADTSNNLYGEASYNGPDNGGVVFELPQAGKYRVLYAFCQQQNCADGTLPNGGLLRDSSGNLYGTTMLGGTGAACGTQTQPGCGTVFRIAPDGSFATLYDFCTGSSCTDGSLPAAGLIEDGSGNLYGTTTLGGNGPCYLGCGTVFKLAPDGTETRLYAFHGGAGDGETPLGALVLNGVNLYGTTNGGGNTDPSCVDQVQDNTCGTIFEVDATGKESILYLFCPNPGCIAGAVPGAVAPVFIGKSFYGTTTYGGAAPDNFGTLWKLEP